MTILHKKIRRVEVGEVKEAQKKSPISKETGLSQNNNLISIESNIAHLASLFELASAQAAQLNNTLHQINQFKLKIDIKK